MYLTGTQKWVTEVHFTYKPYNTLNKITRITRINGQAQSSWLKYYSEKCAVLVVDIVVGSDWATSICSKTYKKTILPQNSALKRCSRVETSQHRVLENTLNMGAILHGLKWFYLRRDAKACKHDVSQTWEVRMITWWMWRGHEPCNPCLSCTSNITLPQKGLRIFFDFY